MRSIIFSALMCLLAGCATVGEDDRMERDRIPADERLTCINTDDVSNGCSDSVVPQTY